MKENLLHFIWKQKLFSSKALIGTQGESIQIISSGIENLHSGPDFLNVKIEINKQLWYGNVEIHIKTSDWYVHRHEIDSNYDAVILHVVWEHDVQIFRKSNESITTLELKSFIKENLLYKYEELFKGNKKWINCEKEIATIKPLKLQNWLENLYFQRLESKVTVFESILDQTNNDWEKTLFLLLAKTFGLKINSEAFFNVANSFDFSIVRKIATNQLEMEALLFGQAGLLNNSSESNYFNELKSTYAFLQVKFKAEPILGNQIQFFRLHPNNFPTIRLSQLAALYHKHRNLFSSLMLLNSLDEFYTIFEIKTAQFWDSHFTFDKESKKSTKKLSKSFVDLLLINTIIPLKFMYLKSMGIEDYSAVLSIIEEIKSEKNGIIDQFNSLKIKSNNALESQSLLQLKNEYCSKQLCLNCAIGNELLKI